MRKLRLALPLALVILVADCTTKQLAVEKLAPEYVPHAALGDVVRLTLAYNDGAAMSLPVGRNARWPLVAISLAAVGVLARLLWLTDPQATGRRVALGLLLGGATGNLLSRAFTARGVVDFIDIGFGAWRFYTFNIADLGITTGACLLGYLLWRGQR